MDRRERSGELLAAILAFKEHVAADIWTALPAIIQSFDPDKKTCVVQPAIKAQLQDPTGTTAWVSLPLLLDCPVQFPGGGGVTLTFPLKEGDECLVVFASRCIDAWWQSGGIQVQAELRMHDLSDGYIIPGISSIPKVQPDISTTEAQLRSDDGTMKIRLDPESGELEALVPGASVKLTENRVDITGVLWINGERYIDHRHSGVQSGGSNTGPKT